MARMIPPRGPDGFKSSAEKTLYRELERQLSDDYVVLHSVSWLSREGGRNQDGEADFVIAHPSHGVLIIEVKGGTISRDGISGEWFSEDTQGTVHPIKDPFEQALNSMYSLRDKLAEAEISCGYRYHLGRAVAFPDVLVDDTVLGPDAPRDIIIDSHDLPTIVRGLQRAWGSPAKGANGEAAVAALIKVLRPPIKLSRPGLVGAMRAEDDQLLTLTTEQMRVLDFVSGHRRVAISGSAGTGKTMVAMEATRRMARQGFRVLFTCFTKALAEAVETTLAHELGPNMEQVVVDNYHDLAARYAKEAGIALPDPARLSTDDATRYYNETLPEYFQRAVETLPHRFDAIVVDEGQDFADIWWVTLEDLFERPTDGILFIFYDENQRLFEQSGALPISESHSTLTRNCRTTRAIHLSASRYLTNGAAACCDGPEGRKPVELVVAAGGEAEALKKALHELVTVEGVPLDEIVVLTPRSNRTSKFTEGMRFGNVALTWGVAGINEVRCRSIATFNGMQSPVVVLAEPDRAHAASANALMHVALTRAKHHVVVLGQLPAPRAIA